MLKKLGKIAGLGLLVLIFSFLLFKYSWQLFDDETELKAFANEIKSTEMIPDSLMEIFTIANPYLNNISMTNEIIIGYGGIIITGKPSYYNNCECDDITRNELWYYGKSPHKKPFPRRIESMRFAFGLESLIGTKACLNYYLVREYSELNQIIKNHGYEWENKSISKLNRNEFIEYITIRNAPSYYSKLLNPERFELRKKVIEEEIQKSID